MSPSAPPRPRRRLRVLSMIGTRPEAIKMAPVIGALEAQAGQVASRVCLTGQHRDLLDPMLEQFSIAADYDLGVMKSGQSIGQIETRVVARLEPVLQRERPDWVLVQGDTTSVLAAALAGRRAGVAIGHVEAGLRTFDSQQPFPEEINRTLVGRLADLHFAPTGQARSHLLREGVDPARIFVTGNTGIDSLYRTVAALQRTVDGDPWVGLPAGARVILATAHRNENLGAPLREICRGLRIVAERYPQEVHIVFPVHPRDAIRETARSHLSGIPNVHLVEPLDYMALVRLLLRCHLVITDSGGLQEEAPALGKPVLVLRNATERPEVLAQGATRLVGTGWDRIVEETARLIEHPEAYRRMSKPARPYGDGRAGERIVEALLTHMSRPRDRTWPGPAATRRNACESVP